MHEHLQERIVGLRVARWGKPLALRVPTEIVRRLGWREGAAVEVRMNVDGSLSIRPAQWGAVPARQEYRPAGSRQVSHAS